MSATRVTWLREVRAFRGAFSCGVPMAAFLAVFGWMFVITLRNNEGSILQIQSIWGLSVAPWLPILSAVLTMRLFAEERSTGMIDLLMSSPIRERELVFGKFLSSVTVVTVALLLSLAAPLLVLPVLAPSLLGAASAASIAATFLILLLQASAWCAAGTMISVLFRNQAAAAVSSLVLCCCIPIAVYAAILAWLPGIRAEMAWMPLMIHVYDFSTGLFSTSVAALYLVMITFFLFSCSKLLACLRVKGTLRASSLLAVALSAVLATLMVTLAYRLNLTWELNVGETPQVSERTRNMLADTQGTVRLTCFMNRQHPMFRPVSRLLRGLQQASRSMAGADIVIQYVDPRWDLARAGQLTTQGVPENALLFERQRRRVVVTLEDMLTQRQHTQPNEENRPNRRDSLGVFRGESVCAAAISRLALPFERATIHWLQGHGEVRFDDYDDLHGFSDIARELKRSGFDLKELSLPGLNRLPDDCHVLVVAGARYALTADELNLLDAFLQNGGRLLYLAAPRVTTGIESILTKWGIELKPFIAVSPKTLSGHEVVITEFADHAVTRNLKNASVVFGYAVCLETSADPSAAAGADRPKAALIAQTDDSGWGESDPTAFPRRFNAQTDLPGPVAVAAVSERGGTVARDVAFRPTRMCVIGETDFVMNSMLASRANANRDLFMNAVAWLAGVDMGSASSVGGDATLVTGFVRRDWVMFMAGAAGAVPLSVFLVFCLISFRSRR